MLSFAKIRSGFSYSEEKMPEKEFSKKSLKSKILWIFQNSRMTGMEIQRAKAKVVLVNLSPRAKWEA